MVERKPDVIYVDPTEIGSGDENLDEDLASLFNLGSADEIDEKVSKIISSDEQNIPVILEIIPSNALRVATVIWQHENIDEFIEGIHPRARDYVRRAIGIVERSISRLLEYEPIKSRIDEDRRAARSEKNTLAAGLNVVNNISHQSTWFVVSGGFMPAVRIAYRDAIRDRVLLDTTSDWSDISFVVESLADIMKGDAEFVLKGNVGNSLCEEAFEIAGKSRKNMEAALVNVQEAIAAIDKVISKEWDGAENDKSEY